MSNDLQERAAARLEEALAGAGARDPRDFYRSQLRELKELDRELYEQAVAYYRETLLPAIVDEGANPLAAWTEYGRRLAELRAPGKTVAVDASGKAAPYHPPADPDHLILHLPDGRKGRALLVGLPSELSPAQRSTFEWLVQGRTHLGAPS